jgi:UDP-4-amino-4,6-dideoxy-N-acetyl-beta-L-altrosamine N-acetyltransferase
MSAAYSFKNFTELTKEESEEVLHGRNGEEVRRWMTSDRMITPEEHREFMRSLKTSTGDVYLMVMRSGHFVGVYSLTDISDGSAVGGFWITNYARQRLLSLSVVFHSVSYVFDKFKIDKIRGYQLTNNKPAAKLNALLGFIVDKDHPEVNPRMQYLTLTREVWSSSILSEKKLLTLIAATERINED